MSSAVSPEPGLTMGEWLDRWLASRVSLRASASRGYAPGARARSGYHAATNTNRAR